MIRREKGNKSRRTTRNSNFNALNKAAMELFGEELTNLSYNQREDVAIYSDNLND